MDTQKPQNNPTRSIKNELKLLKLYWRNYVFQSLLATAAVFFVLIFLEQGEEVIIASLGATAFVVFGLPTKVTAFPRSVVGGHLVGMLCGYAGYQLLTHLPNPDHFVAESAVHAATVGLSIFLMVVLNTEHPRLPGRRWESRLRG